VLRRGVLLALVVLVCGAAAPHRRPHASAPAQRGQPTLRQEPLVIETSRGPVRLQVEIADTERTRNAGLMWRTSVPPFGGMLFDFNPPREVAFWMHNTVIPLDMLFIDPSGRVISIARNTRPRDDTPIPSGGTVRGVLELRGGRAAEIGVLPGDRVRHRIFRGA
jgi:uncharacterized membrane protein (UPF0127 family)